MTTTPDPGPPRLLIEEWLPAQALGVECARERSTGQQPPDKRLHVWWARRPLTVSRAAVLASVLPADFDRATFERLVGFYAPSARLIANEAVVELVRREGMGRIANPHGKRAFNNRLREKDIQRAHAAMTELWGELPTVLDSMAGGGSIPLEAARLGLPTLANELNPVACTVLEATLDYPIRFGKELAELTRQWGRVWRERFNARMAHFYATEGVVPAYTYIYARTVPCPDTGHPTPLVPDWSLLKPKGARQLVAVPRVTDAASGAWTVDTAYVGKGAGEVRQAPPPTYKGGQAISLFTGGVIPSDYIKAMAQQGQMGSALYAVATKATSKLEFRPAEQADRAALDAAAAELARLRPAWERAGVLPTEMVPRGDKTKEPLNVGMARWADLFAPRQLLALGVLVEELQRLRGEIVAAEGEALGEAVVHMLAVVLDKFLNWNAVLASWNAPFATMRSVFDRHDFAFKATYGEMAATTAGGGLAWAIDNVCSAYAAIAALPRASQARPATIARGSAANLAHLDDGAVAALVVDPPYADNVQYAELADFFYVWLKRTQGHRRPEWFSSYLTDKDEEAVVNVSRHRDEGEKAGDAKLEAHEFYQTMMTDIFREARRVLRDDGVLTVMFTHKQQRAWSALFASLMAAGFTITSTFPVQTESQHSLHQAQKNAAQSTVILAARKRDPRAQRGYYDDAMRAEIRQVAQSTAARLQAEGLNAVDQLVGAFGPAMTVFTRYAEVRTDTGDTVDVLEAIQEAANAVAAWRVAQLAAKGLAGVDAESRFVLLCWDVLGAAEFRFNEAMLLGRAVGMDVERLKQTGLVQKVGEKVKMLAAAERRREKPIRSEQELQLALYGPGDSGKGKSKKPKTQRKVHPQDEYFGTAIDMVHALAQRYAEAGGGQAGIGAARGMALQQGWTSASPAALLMAALVHGAPEAVRFPGKKGKKSAADEFPEFRAWHALLKPLFGMDAPDWQEATLLQPTLGMDAAGGEASTLTGWDDAGEDNAGEDNAGEDNAGEDNAGEDNAGEDDAGDVDEDGADEDKETDE